MNSSSIPWVVVRDCQIPPSRLQEQVTFKENWLNLCKISLSDMMVQLETVRITCYKSYMVRTHLLLNLLKDINHQELI